MGAERPRRARTHRLDRKDRVAITRLGDPRHDHEPPSDARRAITELREPRQRRAVDAGLAVARILPDDAVPIDRGAALGRHVGGQPLGGTALADAVVLAVEDVLVLIADASLPHQPVSGELGPGVRHSVLHDHDRALAGHGIVAADLQRRPAR